MTAIPLRPENADQAEYWTENQGPLWVQRQNELDLTLRPFETGLLKRLAAAEGERILDIGCGFGTTSLDIAEQVGPGGYVHGVDISAPMVEKAKARAAEAGLGPDRIAFDVADAGAAHWEGPGYDAACSRFGVMFFADPVGAFAHIRTALKPGGRLVFVCWQTLDRNDWMMVPIKAALQHLPAPEATDPHAPGPFAFADPARVKSLLGDAGFKDVDVHGLETVLELVGGVSAEQATAFFSEIGPLGRLMRDANADADTEAKVHASVLEAFKAHEEGGKVRLPAATWIVSART
jgi:SAM-dependent methyltransferase